MPGNAKRAGPGDPARRHDEEPSTAPGAIADFSVANGGDADAGAAALAAENEGLRAENEALRAGFLPRSDERDRALRAELDSWRDGHRTGFGSGHDVGYGRSENAMERAWQSAAAPVAHGGPPYRELEMRCWTVRGEKRTRDSGHAKIPVDGHVGSRPADS